MSLDIIINKLKSLKEIEDDSFAKKSTIKSIAKLLAGYDLFLSEDDIYKKKQLEAKILFLEKNIRTKDCVSKYGTFPHIITEKADRGILEDYTTNAIFKEYLNNI